MSATRGMLPALSVWIGSIARYASSRPTRAAGDGEDEALGRASEARAARGRRRARSGSRFPSRAPRRARAAGWRRWRRRSGSTTPTAASSVSSAGRIPATMLSCRPRTSADSFALCRDTARPAARKWSSSRRPPVRSVTPGFNRAMTPRKCPPRCRIGGQRQRPPELRVGHERESRRHHADDRHRRAAERDRFGRGCRGRRRTAAATCRG